MLVWPKGQKEPILQSNLLGHHTTTVVYLSRYEKHNGCDQLVVHLFHPIPQLEQEETQEALCPGPEVGIYSR